MAARMGAEADAMRQLWAKATDQVKKTVVSTTVYRALEKTVPIAWEENWFVVGFAGSDGQMAGALNNQETKGVIERALQDVLDDRALRFRIIEGSDYSDWEYAKSRDAAALATRQQTMQKKATESASFNTWDEVYDQVSRLWANSEFRSLPTGRARYFAGAFDMLDKAYATLYPAEGKADEPTERGLSRVIERIASMSNTDSAVVAYLFFERRRGA